MTTTVSAPPALSPHAQVLEMTFARVVTRSVYAIAELGVADHLKDGPKTADELARATGAHAPSLYRLLRTTSALGFFSEDGEKRFSLGPLGEAILSDAPERGRSTVRAVAGDVFWRGLEEFVYSVKTGKSGIEKVFGKNVFEYLSEDPDAGRALQRRDDRHPWRGAAGSRGRVRLFRHPEARRRGRRDGEPADDDSRRASRSARHPVRRPGGGRCRSSAR